MTTFDLTPDPKVLIALTHTPLRPLDALCELIDNAIDSFQVARLQGNPIENPLVLIDLPRKSEILKGEGSIKIRDNGPGMTQETAEKSLRAGFSGNNPYDSLGLFGMGFNIATGKLGKATEFFTARIDADYGIRATIDLEQMQYKRSYLVPVEVVTKPKEIISGTIIEIKGWWPEGNPNVGFIRKLVDYGLPTIRQEIGRRYTTILKTKGIRITVNGEDCTPFEHCVWADNRYVERKNAGKIYAVSRFHQTIGSQKRCLECTALVSPEDSQCQVCGSLSMRSVEEKIEGWIGIQRYDHSSDFGIDLIRNGRAIRIAEKSAFFEYTDELQKTIKDYPIDSGYGRIVGEVHLNHVPVDFLKQDFQRTSPEWQGAMTFLRGNSSLQPTQAGAQDNKSPLYTLYQGYRRVRAFGKQDMYMGFWDKEAHQPKRISRSVEEDYYEKFLKKEPGYYDDSEWWKLVEQADQEPVEELVECPNCHAQNLKEHDVCAICGFVIKGKNCINEECQAFIPISAETCPTCGKSQIPEIQYDWVCQVCGTRNPANFDKCASCHSAKNAPNPLSQEYLSSVSNETDDLSIEGCSIRLSDNTFSSPIDIHVFLTSNPMITASQGDRLPLVSFKQADRMDFFIDPSHPVFRSYHVQPEQLIASEIALYIYDTNKRLSGRAYFGSHSLANLQWLLIEKWAEQLQDDPIKLKDDIGNLFENIRVRLPNVFADMSSDIFDELSDEDKRWLVDNLLNRNKDISKLSEMRQTGEYLYYVSEKIILKLFDQFVNKFFDSQIWDIAFESLPDLPPEAMQQVQSRIYKTHRNCLDDIAAYLQFIEPESTVTRRSRASLQILQQKLVS